ncbi:MAG TPA: DUF2723 domain-containing protein [Herpetosiphonaceae bacterium]
MQRSLFPARPSVRLAVLPEPLRRLAIAYGRAALAFALPFALYLLTLAPTVYNLDSAELTTAAATGGITRATGYPLYLALGRLWSLLPVGDVGYRLNLFSAFCGALTIALADAVLRRLRVGAAAAFGALGLLACATYFWALALIAEVYTLHTALLMGMIVALLRWADQPDARRLALVGALGGLSLSHHGATVLLIPGILWFIFTTAPRAALRPRALAGGLLGLAGGLLPYLYLPLRHAAAPAFNYAGSYDASGAFTAIDLRSAGGLWWLVSGRAFAGQMLGYGDSSFWGEALHFGGQLWRSFFGIGIGPGLLGAALLLRRSWRLGGMLLLMFLGNAIFYIDYRVLDKDTMFLPNYAVWAVWLAVGYQWLIDWLGAPASQRALRAGLIGCALLACAWNWRLVDLSDDWSARERGEAVLAEAAPGALVLGWWDTVPVVEYLQLVEGRRPDVTAINRFLVAPDALEPLIRRSAAARPVYIDSVPAGGLDGLLPIEAGPLFRVYPQPALAAPRQPRPANR